LTVNVAALSEGAAAHLINRDFLEESLTKSRPARFLEAAERGKRNGRGKTGLNPCNFTLCNDALPLNIETLIFC
jgi:hypothetical protein